VAIGLCTLVAAAMCGLMRMMEHTVLEEHSGNMEAISPNSRTMITKLKQKKIEANIRTLLGVTATFIFAVYISSMLRGNAVRMLATVKLFLGVAGVMAFGFFGKNLRPEVLEQAKGSKMVKNLIALSEKDAARAAIAIPGVFLCPLFFFLGWLKQRVRLLRNPTLPADMFSPTIQRVYNNVVTWHVGGVMSWMLIISMLIFALDVVGKTAYVLLAIVAERIKNYSLILVSVTLAFVGFLVFMNPLMPGPVVYFVVGVVVTRRICDGAKASAGLEPEDACPDITFASSLFLCTTICFLVKLAAVCGQMEIGRLMGLNVRIQRLCQVDQPFIRAIELILGMPGLFPGKVAILCGGPDWPTSVLCGILRQSKAKMCFGTSPMFFVCMPSVLGGAILNMPPGGIWGQLVGLALLFALLSQTLIGVVATYYVNEYMGTDDPEVLKQLYDPRPEHAAVEELSRKSAAYEAAFRTVTAWSRMTGTQRKLLVVGTAGTLGTALLVSTNSSTFFRKFSATSKIHEPYDKEPPGLNGSALNLVKSPQGWVLIAVHYASYCVYYAWGKSVGASATQSMVSMNGAENGVEYALEDETSTVEERVKNGEVVHVDG
jgi:hypothetical protein